MEHGRYQAFDLGCTQMVCGLLVMLGGLLILLVGMQNAGMLVLIGFVVLLVSLAILLAGYFERVASGAARKKAITNNIELRIDKT